MTESSTIDALRVDTAPTLSDEAIEKARSLIGVWLRRDVHLPSIYEPISPHDIRRWANYSVGDDNPLFCDPGYCKQTVWGTTIAPPTFLYTIDSGIVAPGLPGIQWIFAGGRFEHFEPVRAGDTITARARVIDVQIKEGRAVPRFVNQVGEVIYANQLGQTVCRYEGDIFRVPRAKSGQGFKFKNETGRRTRYTTAEISEIAAAYRSEERRGAAPRYWEDVAVGDTLPTIVKGPLTLVDIVGFYAGRRTVYNVMKLAFAERDKHPSNVYVSPASGVPMHPAAGHFDVEIAQEVGFPGAYDQGWQRLNWGAHLLTNWCGDMGFVRRYAGRVLVPNLVGDLTRVTGEVVDKTKQDGEALVHVAWRGTNQRGEKNSDGTAVIRLPSRDVSIRR
jgi:acyl dehydratase